MMSDDETPASLAPPAPRPEASAVSDSSVRADTSIPHMLSPGSFSQSSSEDMSIEAPTIPSRPPHVQSADSGSAADDIPIHHDASSGRECGEEEEKLEEEDIELGTPVVSFEEGVDIEDDNNVDDVDCAGFAPTSSNLPVQTPPPTRKKSSLTINTRDVWEEHPGKKKTSSCIKTKSFQLDTPSTVATTPTTPTSPSGDSVYTIEHKHTYKRSKQSKAIAFSKPVIAIAGIVVVALTGGGAYLFSEWFTIPGLTAQIQELETQVKLLTAQIDRLEDENDRFSQLNDRLEEENTVFASEIVKFNNTNALYAELNLELSDLTADNMRLNDMLNASNVRYQQLNIELDETKNDLEAQVDALSVENTKLDATVASYSKENQILSGQVDRLEAINDDFAVEVANLNSTATTLARENNRLSALNDDLGVIAGFLNETTGKLVDSYDDIARYLVKQIDAGRAIWTRTTQNLYRARTNNMVCDIQSRFSGQEFVVNPMMPIGSAYYSEVMGYVDETMLSELCIGREHFEEFLLGESELISSTDVTLNDLVRSLTRYNMMVFDYYFPRDTSRVDNSEALSADDWASANYQCEGLPLAKRFIWPMVVQQPKSENSNGDV